MWNNKKQQKVALHYVKLSNYHVKLISEKGTSIDSYRKPKRAVQNVKNCQLNSLLVLIGNILAVDMG